MRRFARAGPGRRRRRAQQRAALSRAYTSTARAPRRALAPLSFPNTPNILRSTSRIGTGLSIGARKRSSQKRRKKENRTSVLPPKVKARAALAHSAPTNIRKYKTAFEFRRLNERRKSTRNRNAHRWTKCTRKPNSRKAANMKHKGTGDGRYEPRRWC